MLLRCGRFILLFCLYGLWLVACNGRDAPPVPTLVPTAVLPSPTATALPPTATAVPTMTPSPSAPSADTPTFADVACERFPALRSLRAENITCGFVTVAEDREGEGQNKLRLAVVRIASTGPAPDPAPLVFLPGGPGRPVLHHIADYYDRFIPSLSPDRDIIFFDPRGVGLSEPALDCWELKLTYLQDLGQAFPQAERADQYAQALSTCHSRLRGNGINLAAYHSGTIAADVKDILQVMGYDQAHLFGVSYGTRLAQQLMRDYPALVKTAVLDSVVPMDNQFIPESTDWQAEALAALFEACAAQAACQAGYPELAAVYRELQTTLSEAPVPVILTDPIQGNRIEIMADHQTLDTALQWALPNDYLSPLIPQMLYNLREGDGALLGSALTLPLLAYGDMSLGMMISTLCHDQVFSLTPEQLATGAASHPYLGLFQTVAAFDDGRFLFEMCQQWGAAPPEPRANEPVRSEAPALILTGQLDTTTPPAYGRRVAETLPQSYVVELPNQGHAPAFGPAADCLHEMIRGFLDEPGVAPAHSCRRDRAQTTFFVPYDGAAEIPLHAFAADNLPFTVLAPANWEAGEYNHFRWSRFPGDVAQLAVQAAPNPIEEWLDFLVSNYAGAGLGARPEYSGEISRNGRLWRLYTATADNQQVTFAFSREGEITYHVSMASTEAEHAALYDNLLLPVLASLTVE